MKHRGILLIVGALVILSLVISGFGCAAPAPEPAPTPTPTPTPEQPVILLRNSVMSGPEVDISKSQKWFSDEVERRTNGRVKSEMFYGTLAKPPDALDVMSSGVGDVGYVSIPYLPSFLPISQVSGAYLPDFSVDGAGLAFMELVNTWAPLRDEWASYNVKYLYHFQFSPSIIGSSTPIYKIADLEGMKIRAHTVAAAVLSKLGAIPVAVAAPEIYEAQMRGTTDGVSSLYFGWYMGNKLYEVAPYLIDPGINALGASGVVINLDVWDSLPEDIQQIMMEVAQEAPRKYVEIMAEDDAKYLKILDSSGVTITQFSTEEQAQFSAMMGPIAEEWIETNEAKGIPAREAYERLVELVKKYKADSIWVNPMK